MSPGEWTAELPRGWPSYDVRMVAAVEAVVAKANAELEALRRERNELVAKLSASQAANRKLNERLQSALMQLGGEP